MVCSDGARELQDCEKCKGSPFLCYEDLCLGDKILFSSQSLCVVAFVLSRFV